MKLNVENIKAAIKAQKWDKSMYIYAIRSMDHWRIVIGGENLYKKDEVISIFWELAETKFNRIESFTTFKNVDCYIEVIEEVENEFEFKGEIKFYSVINQETSFGSTRLSEDTESIINVKIRKDGSGFFEWIVEELDLYEEGCLLFEDKVLVEYDGVFSLPVQLLNYLSDNGYNVEDINY